MAKAKPKDAAPEAPENIHVKVLRDTPQIQLNNLSSKYYKKGWIGLIPADVAADWKKAGYVAFTSDLEAGNNPLPVEGNSESGQAPEKTGNETGNSSGDQNSE